MFKQTYQVFLLLAEDIAAIVFELALFAAIIHFSFRNFAFWPF